MDGARALADPVRREILELLRASPQPAGRIAERFPISRPAVSKHLHVLLECGAVTVTARGRERVYELRTEPFDELAAYLAVLTAPPFAPQLDALATEVARTRRERRTADAARSTALAPEQNRRRRA